MQGGDGQSQGPFRNPVLDVVLGAGGPEGLEGGRWMADADKRDSLPQNPRSLFRLSIPTSHLGGDSQTGRAPFILKVETAKSSCVALCVTATVLTYHQMPCLLNTEHDGSAVCTACSSSLGPSALESGCDQ